MGNTRLARKHCYHCGTDTRHEMHPSRTSGAVHFILAVMTCGLWLILWLLYSAAKYPWFCSICGEKQSFASGFRAGMDRG